MYVPFTDENTGTAMLRKYEGVMVGRSGLPETSSTVIKEMLYFFKSGQNTLGSLLSYIVFMMGIRFSLYPEDHGK